MERLPEEIKCYRVEPAQIYLWEDGRDIRREQVANPSGSWLWPRSRLQWRVCISLVHISSHFPAKGKFPFSDPVHHAIQWLTRIFVYTYTIYSKTNTNWIMCMSNHFWELFWEREALFCPNQSHFLQRTMHVFIKWCFLMEWALSFDLIFFANHVHFWKSIFTPSENKYKKNLLRKYSGVEVQFSWRR